MSESLRQPANPGVVFVQDKTVSSAGTKEVNTACIDCPMARKRTIAEKTKMTIKSGKISNHGTSRAEDKK